MDEQADGEPTVFGWGNAVADLDNDGDQDIFYAGGLDSAFFVANDNGGHLLENRDCRANFDLNLTAFPDTNYYVEGTGSVATGDLNGDGYLDIITASEHTLPALAPLVPLPPLYGTSYEGTGAFFLPFAPTPITAGSSFLGQHAMNAHFGLGKARWGTVTVDWPGGVRNQLFRVRAGETVVMPEIPCDVAGRGSKRKFVRCLTKSLLRYVKKKVISRAHSRRLFRSQLLARYFSRHNTADESRPSVLAQRAPPEKELKR